jgi:hypothetical protein
MQAAGGGRGRVAPRVFPVQQPLDVVAKVAALARPAGIASDRS